jgi:hypothetical protein
LNLHGLSCEQILHIASGSGFSKRKPRKISVIDFLGVMCQETQNGAPSYNDLAAGLYSANNVLITKQAFCKRVTPECALFFQSVLGYLIRLKTAIDEQQKLKACGKYKRVIIQDSTIIKLPLRLFEHFCGVSNKHCSVCNARIQSAYDLISGQFIYFSIDSYSKNDYSAAADLKINENDLVLRDRGYFSQSEILRQMENGADFIFRHKCKTLYLDPVSHKPINLLALLKKHGMLDIEVCMNNKKRTKIRLVAVPVGEKLANRRKQQAKKQLHGHNPCAELLALTGWNIYVTSIPKDQMNTYDISNTYRLRWFIEIIFKSWKSHLKFDHVHNVSLNQLKVMITSRLITIALYTTTLYHPLNQRLQQKYRRSLSLLKFLNYLNKNQNMILVIVQSLIVPDIGIVKEVDKILIHFCVYDKRKRQNIAQLWEEISLS